MPLFPKMRRTTRGILLVTRHLSTRYKSGGISGPFWVSEENAKYGGTFGNRLGTNIVSGLSRVSPHS